MSKVRRVLSVVCLLVFLGLPLAAQSEREPASPVARFLEAVWERLSATLSSASPVTAIWAADEGGAEDRDGSPEGTVLSPWDPLGNS